LSRLNGIFHRDKIVALVDNHLAENDFEKQPELIKFKCLVNDKYEEVVAHKDLVASDLGQGPFWSWSQPFSGDLGGHGQLLPFA